MTYLFRQLHLLSSCARVLLVDAVDCTQTRIEYHFELLAFDECVYLVYGRVPKRVCLRVIVCGAWAYAYAN